MNDTQDHGLKEVFRAYSKEKKREEFYGEWGAAIAYRPVSLLLTPLFLKLGVAPTVVTAFAMVVVVLLPVAALLGGALGFVYLAIGGVIIAILDCLDGNIARASGQTSKAGHYADFIVDVINRGVMYATIGVLIANAAPAGNALLANGMAIGLLAALLANGARLSRVYMEGRFSGQDPYARPDDDIAVSDWRLSDFVFAFLSGIDPLLPFFILLTGAFDVLHWLLFWLVAYSAADFLLTQLMIFRRLR